ncbi:hypothetical protein LF130101_1324 [Limosilactobacillus fermentum]|nr:hypothetical protein LF130101_1324 [Limosilactobacillus fermentum]
MVIMLGGELCQSETPKRRGKTRGRQPADREEQLLKEIRDLKAKLREREVQIAFSKKLIEISNREVKRPNDIKRFKK